ncbi:MAG TPA: ECF-type sigma factor [Vicinamibacterales bacterium]|nr:ECF-type sigma factor [Vicinamibacterales bacterium]
MEPDRATFASLYAELHRIARREVGRQGRAARVSATTLLHEAYLDMAERQLPRFPDEARFMRYAARVMRGVIIDDLRERQAAKRGGGFVLTTLGDAPAQRGADARQLSAISDALDELAKTDAALAEVVDLKFFCGFSFGEIAAMRGTSERTVQRTWDKARIYLHHALRPAPPR